jgi:hypothetical protein
MITFLYYLCTKTDQKESLPIGHLAQGLCIPLKTGLPSLRAACRIVSGVAYCLNGLESCQATNISKGGIYT